MVRYRKGHKNSKGEKAEWCIVSHATGKVISSHKSKSAAKKHLGDIRKFKHMKENSGINWALSLLRKSGYLCEHAVVACPTFDEYVGKVRNEVAKSFGKGRAEMVVAYYEAELQDYYGDGWDVQRAADAIIDQATPSPEQKEALDYMYNNYDYDYARSYGPMAAYREVADRTLAYFDGDAYIPSDLYEFEIIYGKSIDE